ncbi:enhanced serine sensitivity protein SseB C-terminal domain-containing protein [Streptomyces sp. DSM 44917]|uniref:Enhanced serine sensitivity protein SseB C-terminal domain-containing protein n=1 Tax=Streptomyces boetiae TaxID=3075541 RepID=A0ABU2L5Q0_9ACTN|nr:enhanced serine sensitivity protein SseB C-terminal domain-containing protein [Streptomyces sp. DSM 44917]MDT0306890.1 enhanced serine sensitivity protein SseB C-terminal domain-containing protein [Streptomyces sp. DSM 44917]
MSPGRRRSVGELLPRVTRDRLDTYEELLAALSRERVWMLLWHGRPGDPDAQYGSVEVAGHGYAPGVTSAEELAASGWTRAHEVVPGRDIAAALYPEHWGLWLNPHAPGGGLGIPWLDLRRIAGGLDRLPAGPLRISEPSVRADAFYARLVTLARGTPVLRTLRRAWVRPALGTAYLVIGLDVDDPGERTAAAVRDVMRQAITAVPDGLAVGTVAMADAYDPVAMWLRANARPFYDRDAPAGAPSPAPGLPALPGEGSEALRRHGYGYPRPL